MSDISAIDHIQPTTFECAVLDADEAALRIKQRVGLIVYVRLLSGTLPPYLPNVLVGPYGYLHGRPLKGAFAPVPARLAVPAGRSYYVTLLAALPPLHAMRSHMRSGLNPPYDLDPSAVPVALEGLPRGFRATTGRLIAVPEQGTPEFDRLAVWSQVQEITYNGWMQARQLPKPGNQEDTSSAIEKILEALTHELEEVRDAAARALRPFAAQIPLAPFLSAIRDKRRLNHAACRAAAYIFTAHPDEVPIEALLDLYSNLELGPSRPLVQVVVIQAMGRLGDRVPDTIIDLLASILIDTQIGSEKPASHDVRVPPQAALALEQLEERAPVAALIAGMENIQPEVIVTSARALLRHPADVPAEMKERARLMSDLPAARAWVQSKFRSRQT